MMKLAFAATRFLNDINSCKHRSNNARYNNIAASGF